jgi:hypothetical protein
MDAGALAASRVGHPTLQEQGTKHAGHGPEGAGPSPGRGAAARRGWARLARCGIRAEAVPQRYRKRDQAVLAPLALAHRDPAGRAGDVAAPHVPPVPQTQPAARQATEHRGPHAGPPRRPGRRGQRLSGLQELAPFCLPQHAGDQTRWRSWRPGALGPRGTLPLPAQAPGALAHAHEPVLRGSGTCVPLLGDPRVHARPWELGGRPPCLAQKLGETPPEARRRLIRRATGRFFLKHWRHAGRQRARERRAGWRIPPASPPPAPAPRSAGPPQRPWRRGASLPPWYGPRGPRWGARASPAPATASPGWGAGHGAPAGVASARCGPPRYAKT